MPNPHAKIPPGNPHFGGTVAALTGAITYNGGADILTAYGTIDSITAPLELTTNFTGDFSAGATSEQPVNRASNLGGIIQLGPVGGVRG